MSRKLRFFGAPVTHILAVATISLLTPIASWAGSTHHPDLVCNPRTVCVANDQGTLSGSNSGLTLTGSTVTQIGDFFGTDLGTLTLSTGSLTSGSLETGGTFAGGGTFTITQGSAVLFSGNFSGPVTWTAENLTYNKQGVVTGCGKGGCIYILAGTVSGMYGPGGLPVTGGTVQQTINTSHPFNGGTLTIENGSTFLVTPEPSTLGLMGTGFLGLGMIAKRKFKNKNGMTQTTLL